MILFNIIKSIIIKIMTIFEISFENIFEIIIKIIKTKFDDIVKIVIKIIIINKTIIEIIMNFLKIYLIQFC